MFWQVGVTTNGHWLAFVRDICLNDAIALVMRTPVSARARLECALARIQDPSGEGTRTFLTLYPEAAREAADVADRRARDGNTLGSLDGVIVSIKDLFDVEGEPTRAGSTILADAPPAAADAPIVERLKEAGAVIVGKTNMSEFAFTGVGANPHFGTPGNPADRSRVPGGSSSGAAASVADDMCEISIGTDTGGSTRIPAALCGIVGYKPTKARIPTEGAFPLSPTLDSIGPLARSVEACAKADAVLAGEQPWVLEPVALNGLRLGIPRGLPLDDLDAIVGGRFEDALGRLGRAGARISEMEFSLFDEMAHVQSAATIATVEAYQIHHQRIAEHGADYDPIVRSRIETGGAVSTADYLKMIEERNELANAMDLALADVDALILPTTPIVAPTLEEISSPREFNRANRLLLRNTAIANFFDLCAISLPMPDEGGLPSGLMLFARRGQDRRLFRIAASIEDIH
jgi:aspartyl-tRNA(Asn)/glutamyl-tRNA(Gln) amidotransferase subunit A